MFLTHMCLSILWTCFPLSEEVSAQTLFESFSSVHLIYCLFLPNLVDTWVHRSSHYIGPCLTLLSSVHSVGDPGTDFTAVVWFISRKVTQLFLQILGVPWSSEVFSNFLWLCKTLPKLSTNITKHTAQTHLHCILSADPGQPAVVHCLFAKKICPCPVVNQSRRLLLLIHSTFCKIQVIHVNMLKW